MNEELLIFAEEISLRAGEILMDGFRSDETIVSYKSRTNLVTDKDRESEDYLFGEIRKKYPDHDIIAEEGSRHESEHNLIWYVDPLDATTNYAHGIPFFCTSIGVFSRKENSMVAGVVYDPVHNELFTASRGNGARLNGKSIRVSDTPEVGISIIATGFPYEKNNPLKNNLDRFNRVLPTVQGIRRFGSAALDLCYVACGRIDGYFEPELWPWDMSAGSLIVQEAGGRVSDFDNGAFDPEKPEIVATNLRIHEELISITTS